MMERLTLNRMYSLLKKHLWGEGDRELLIWKVNAEYGNDHELFIVVGGYPVAGYARFMMRENKLTFSASYSGEWSVFGRLFEFDKDEYEMLGTVSVAYRKSTAVFDVDDYVTRVDVDDYVTRGYTPIELDSLRIVEDL